LDAGLITSKGNGFQKTEKPDRTEIQKRKAVEMRKKRKMHKLVKNKNTSGKTNKTGGLGTIQNGSKKKKEEEKKGISKIKGPCGGCGVHA